MFPQYVPVLSEMFVAFRLIGIAQQLRHSQKSVAGSTEHIVFSVPVCPRAVRHRLRALVQWPSELIFVPYTERNIPLFLSTLFFRPECLGQSKLSVVKTPNSSSVPREFLPLRPIEVMGMFR